MQPRTEGLLIWISGHQAINPANIIDVFHGNHGEIQIALVGGRRIELSEESLTPDARSWLLPPVTAARGAAPALVNG
jgi:hypothetical protein